MSARRGLAVLLLALAAGGCTTLRPPWSVVERPSPALPAGVPTADQLAMPHRTRALHLQRSGQLRPAVEAWTTALALAPGHEPSRQALRRLRERIDREVAEHVRLGWQALARDDAAGARRHFHAALALDSESRSAREALRAVGPAPAYDAEASRPVPAPRPAAVPVAEPRLQQPEGPRAEPSKGEVTPVAPENPAPPVEPEPRPAGAAPNRPATLYVAARAHLTAGRDDAAYRTLVELTRVSPGYRDAATLLRELRSRLARQRYQEGLRLFREEQLEDAITQWRAVLELDPGHVHARRHIEQAEKMLRTLAAHQKR